MHLIHGLIREPAVLVVALILLTGLSLPLVDAFLKAITDGDGRRSTIVMRCLAGETPLWVVYWLFGIVGGVFAGLVSLFAAAAFPSLGFALMGLFGIWWSISLWRCAQNVAFQFLSHISRGLLVLGLLGSGAYFSGLIVLGEEELSRLLSILSWLLVAQFALVYLVAFFTGFAAEGRIRVSPQMAWGLHRMRSADIGIKERPEDRQCRESGSARYLEKGRTYPGDTDSHANGFGGGGGASC